jgi:hypothetical protein
MARKMMSNSNLKPVCSVIDLIRMLELSRARFYQLLKQGIFPPPVFDLRTRRPFYSLELQQICLEVRESNIGFNGSYALFYRPRTDKQNISKKSESKNKNNNSAHQELTETLKRMGLDVNAPQVGSAIQNLFPDGTDTADSGIVIRELFRFFKKGASN